MSSVGHSETTKVGDQGETEIPESLREKFGIEPGDEVLWIDGDDEIRLKKRTKTEARGMLVDDDADEELRQAAADAFLEELREARENEWSVREE